jgi:triosephosphate isomerase
MPVNELKANTRKPIIVGNWKMQTTLADAMILAETIQHGLESITDCEAVLCPPYTWLYPVKEALSQGSPSHIQLGAQNVYSEEEGAYTGEISIKMLKGLVRFVLVGHSERRYKIGAGEDDTTINKKLRLISSHGLRPILCVGEKVKQVKRGRGRPRLEHGLDIVEQLKRDLAGVANEDMPKVVIAYEPVWAIGTGDPATGEYANTQIARLRQALQEWYGQEVANLTRIIYGGSTDSDNAPEFLAQPEIDGLLPGGSSLKASEFILMCKQAATIHTTNQHQFVTNLHQ